MQLEMSVRPGANVRPRCSRCPGLASLYDHLAERRFRFPALWSIPVFLVYRMRRLRCEGRSGPMGGRHVAFAGEQPLAALRNEPLLRNLVRLKYDEWPLFLETTGLSRQYRLGLGTRRQPLWEDEGEGRAGDRCEAVLTKDLHSCVSEQQIMST